MLPKKTLATSSWTYYVTTMEVTTKDGIKIYKVDRVMSFADAKKRRTTQVEDSDYSFVIDHDADAYDSATGELLFRFRKGAMPTDVLDAGVSNFKHSIAHSANRGDAAGGTKARLDSEGNPTNVMMAEPVESGNVGFMDAGGMQRYCRMTAFGREHFDKLQLGRPFVEFIDKKYKELCPTKHAAQLKTANETNANYVLWDTAFSTVTVNKNFNTAIHVDGGDHPEGFGNLFVYREGDWTGGYFTLLEYGIAIDMANQDMLFVDVHRHHANSPWTLDPENGDLRISFVLYYRTGLMKCDSPSEEVRKAKMKSGQYLRL